MQMPAMQMPGMPMRNMPAQSAMQQPMMPIPHLQSVQPTQQRQWQAVQGQAPMPSPAYLASGKLPPQPAQVKARGVMEDPAPAVTKFLMPSPEDLGIAANVNVAKQPAPVTPADWNALHARMERLGVLRYQKDRLPTGGIRVTLLLPTPDPTKGQPVEAVAESEASATAAALQRSEAWMQQR